MTRSFRCLLLAAMIGGCMLPEISSAAGFAIHEQSGQAMGTAGAFAGAQSPASIFYNPAGIANLSGKQLEIGLNILMPKTDFYGPTSFSSFDKHSMKEQTFTPVDLYYTAEMANGVFGIGVFTYLGLGTKWEDNWIGRSVTEEISMETIAINPVYAMKVGENGAVAFGVDFIYAMALLSKDTPTLEPTNAYMDVEIEGSGMAFGFNLGYQHQLSSELRVGVSYRSAHTITAEGDATFEIQNLGHDADGTKEALLTSLFPDSDVELDIETPALAILGFEYNPASILDGKLTWRGDVVYTGWDVYEELAIDFTEETYKDPPANTQPALADNVSEKDYQNTLAFRTGIEVKFNEEWTGRCGYYYEENAVKTELVEPSLPDAERNGYSFGLSYEVSDTFGLDFYYLQVMLQDRVSTFEDFPGGYESSIPIFGLSTRFSF
jgi:long-chain fatty acid transport protein